MFSWEAWGSDPAPDLVTCAGVGHSPAATAWWLHLQKGNPKVDATRLKAVNHIINSSLAGGLGIRGLVPNAWPMNRFEQSFVLHILFNADLLLCRKLADVLIPQLEDLRLALSQSGLGFSDYFTPDGDDTAAAVAAIAGAGMAVDRATLADFERADHFVAYPYELHGSFTVTARATQALALSGFDASHWRSSVEQAQRSDGWWPSDKWNSSRLYGTSVAIAALGEGVRPSKVAAAEAFLRYQHGDGGWGCSGSSTLVETALGLLALRKVAPFSGFEVECRDALCHAHQHLCSAYKTDAVGREHIWICKELFSARRIDHAIVLSALIASSFHTPTSTSIPVNLSNGTQRA